MTMETKEEILKNLEEMARSGTGKVWSVNPLNKYPNYKSMKKSQLIELRGKIRDHNIKLLVDMHNAYLEQEGKLFHF